MRPLDSNTRFREHVSRLHQTSEAETYANARSQFAGTDEDFLALAARYAELAPDQKGAFLAAHGISVQDASLSLAVSPEMGEFLYTTTLARRAAAILELGSSNGVSTLYFAEALRVLGGGTVVATELERAKCARLEANVAAVGLGAHVDLRQGDVFDTLTRLQGPFDIVFIDIWASGYLDVFKAVEPLLRPGTIVLADNMFTAPEAVEPFKAYLDATPNIRNTTLAFESGVEFAVVL